MTGMFHRAVARAVSPLLSFADRRPMGAALAAAQERILRKLLRTLAPLPVGRHFGLDKVAAHAPAAGSSLVADFRRLVPINGYGEHAELIARVAAGERDVMFPGRALALAQTSGTTSGATSGHAGERYVPQNADLLRHHSTCGAAAFFRLLQATGVGLLDGRLLMLGGSTALTPNAVGIPIGDLSGIIAQRVPAWLRPLYEPGLDIALESDWERKLERVAERLGHADVRLVSGIPAWQLMLFERVCRRRDLSRIRIAWPNLSGFIHGGHAITPFLPTLRNHLSSDTWLFEVYPASEAFIAVGSRAWRLDEQGPPALDLLCDHGVFLEFAPADGGLGDSDAVVGPESLVDGRLYRVLVTTPAGLVRYQLGDLVLGAGPGRVRFAGRVKARISVFGEHVEGVHLDGALAAAVSASGAEVAHYHVAPILPGGSDHHACGAHEWLIEFTRAPADAQRFAALLDQHLRVHVLDYDAHRAGGQLAEARLTALPAGTFHRFLADAGKLGGQHKMPQAWGDRTIADALASAACHSPSSTGSALNATESPHAR